MSRFYADLCLALAALIWGLAFIAQKLATGHVGAFTFVASRFALSALVVAPLALREHRTGEPMPPVQLTLLLAGAKGQRPRRNLPPYPEHEAR